VCCLLPVLFTKRYINYLYVLYNISINVFCCLLCLSGLLQLLVGFVGLLWLSEVFKRGLLNMLQFSTLPWLVWYAIMDSSSGSIYV